MVLRRDKYVQCYYYTAQFGLRYSKLVFKAVFTAEVSKE